MTSQNKSKKVSPTTFDNIFFLMLQPKKMFKPIFLSWGKWIPGNVLYISTKPKAEITKQVSQIVMIQEDNISASILYPGFHK